MLLKVCLLFALLLPAGQVSGKGTTMHHAAGTFEVTLQSEPLSSVTAGTGLARMSIDKTFHGDIEGFSKGEMLSYGNPSGSAGYVALEKVTGKVEGATGTFVLQHTATMNRGVPTLSITVVPDSGTEALKGIAGKLDIQMAGGKHSYTFDYTLLPQS